MYGIFTSCTDPTGCGPIVPVPTPLITDTGSFYFFTSGHVCGRSSEKGRSRALTAGAPEASDSLSQSSDDGTPVPSLPPTPQARSCRWRLTHRAWNCSPPPYPPELPMACVCTRVGTRVHRDGVTHPPPRSRWWRDAGSGCTPRCPASAAGGVAWGVVRSQRPRPGRLRSPAGWRAPWPGSARCSTR